MSQAGEFGLVVDDAFVQYVVEADGQGHEFGHAGDAWRQLGFLGGWAKFDSLAFGFDAIVEFSGDGGHAASSSLRLISE
jgi:hypothetical protein